MTSRETTGSVPARKRLNGPCMATFFGGGAIGSAVGARVFARAGRAATALVGMAAPALALHGLATISRRAPPAPAGR